MILCKFASTTQFYLFRLMKTTRFIILSFLLLQSAFSIAQSNLIDSQRFSTERHIYKIDRDDLRKVHLKEEGFNEAMLDNFVAKYKKGEQIPDLNRGNYVIVSVIDNQLDYAELIIDDLYAKIIPSEKFAVCLYDSLGNIISDAKSSKLKYDKKTQTYSTGKVKNEQIIEIDHKGVFHYLEVGSDHYARKNFLKSTWWKINSWWDNIRYRVKYVFYPSERPMKHKYTGFIVFSKPKYKPGETVKLKAYLSEHNGKRYDKPVDIKLRKYSFSDIDTILTRLEPYQAGMYSYEFKLTEELDLTLDNNYSILLITDDENSNTISNDFRYEDYELKSISFSVKSDKEEFVSGDSVKLDMKVTDENEMAVYDGKVDILVTSQGFDRNKMKRMETIFIPDTLWSYTVDMSGTSGKELIIPDSIFPSDVDIKFKVECTYLSADNEKHVKSLSLSKSDKKYMLDFSLDKGMLTIRELYLGKSQPAMAEIIICGENDEYIYQDSVMLPHTLAVPWHAADVTVESKKTKDYYFPDDARDEQLGYKFYRNNDSICLKVDNPAGIPFWYTVRKMKKEIAGGYTTQLNYAIKDTGENGYSMQLSYFFGGESKSIQGALPFARKNITMDVTTPTTVYPGQKANVQISVTDKKGNPVKDADITAYSFTSKFNNYSMPNVLIGGKTRYANQFRNAYYNMDEDLYYNGKSNLTWKRWADAMALDTVEYYKFLYPETYYAHKEKTSNGNTLISPFVVINGEVQGVHLLWIDERLYYANQAEHLNVYSFEIKPGKHNLRFRTHDREVSVHNLYLEEGQKYIFSFNAEKPYTMVHKPVQIPFLLTSRLLDKKERGYLSEKEEYELRSQLVTVDNNFGEIQLPNIDRRVEVPGYINTGNTLYYLNHISRVTYNQTLRAMVKTPVLAGPFPKRTLMGSLSNMASIYAGDKFLVNTEIEGGNLYTLYPDYQKIKQWDKSVINRNISAFKPALNFKQQSLTQEDIEERVKNNMMDVMCSVSGFVDARQYYKAFSVNNYRLNLILGQDTAKREISPTLIFIEPQKEENRQYYQLYYGGTKEFKNIPVGELTLHLIFRDSTSYSCPVQLRKGGMNYLRVDSITTYHKNTEIARIAYNIFNKEVKTYYVENPYISKPASANDAHVLSPAFDSEKFKTENKTKKVVTGIVTDSRTEPVIGASVLIKGTKRGTITDFDGKFEMAVDDKAVLEVAFIGYKSKEIKVSTGHEYDVVLEEDAQYLQEVVVIGYGVAKRKSLTGSVATVHNDKSLASILDNQHLQGKLAGLATGIRIRGAASTNAEAKPLIVINGLPFDGSLNDIDASSILSLNILKDAAAISIYGARGANGVIMIETNALSAPKPAESENATNEEPGNSMRRNFHDDAFWQPKLKTNEKGEANFEVTYPDDITNWNAYFITLGGENQSDTKQVSIKSFKALSARLSTPRFAIRGDSLNAVGKIANHFGDSLQLTRTIERYNNKQTDKIRIGNSYVDYIPADVTNGDSLTLAYSLQMENGYFDGEERSLPIFEQGLLQTYGDFKVINDSSTHTLKVDPKLGAITVHAEASSLELFLREIKNIDLYSYMCNEQMASKIKALLAKKYIFKLQRKEFKEDKKINSLIRDLNKNKNQDGLWGWWNKSGSVMWISQHVTGALLDAEEAGYKTGLNKQALASTLEQELKDGLSALSLAVDKKLPHAKGELLDRLLFLKRLDAPIDYNAYLREIDSRLKSQTTRDKLKTMLAMSVTGQQESIRMDSLMHYSDKTILGSLYWGEEKINKPHYRYFYRPYETNTENTLLAYQILRNTGGYEKLLEGIRNYFFEQRQNNTWNNIYESSRIVQTIMPDMLKATDKYGNVVMNMNGNRISEFPYTTTLDPTEKVEVSKTGAMPLFITAYQKEWNRNPAKEQSKGFEISTIFKMNNDSIANLKEGKPAILQATLNMDGDAEYVQIEIPIPAGCSYESKSGGNRWKEAHREYYKEKVVIFCNKLSKGEHIFTIELLPRYTGRYTLNPAKAELMYFPTFYGNEEVKTTLVE